MRTDFVRKEVQRLLRQAPFRPFLLVRENGERVLIEHPEKADAATGLKGERPEGRRPCSLRVVSWALSTWCLPQCGQLAADAVSGPSLLGT